MVTFREFVQESAVRNIQMHYPDDEQFSPEWLGQQKVRKLGGWEPPMIRDLRGYFSTDARGISKSDFFMALNPQFRILREHTSAKHGTGQLRLIASPKWVLVWDTYGAWHKAMFRALYTVLDLPLTTSDKDFAAGYVYQGPVSKPNWLNPKGRLVDIDLYYKGTKEVIPALKERYKNDPVKIVRAHRFNF